MSVFCRFGAKALVTAAALTFIRRAVSSVRLYTAGSDEVERAQFAANQSNKAETIFDKILRKEIPADIVHEDNQVRWNLFKY